MNNHEQHADLLELLPNLPRINGELIFDSPWEARLFGMALVLHENQSPQWTDITRMFHAYESNTNKSPYYERWLAALEHALIQGGLITEEELEERAREFSD